VEEDVGGNRVDHVPANTSSSVFCGVISTLSRISKGSHT
jgi:hypothetical protein